MQIEITLPYRLRHLSPELKRAGGRFNGKTKIWTLPKTAEAERISSIITKPIPVVSQEERVRHVAATAVELLNGLKHRQFRLAECGERIVIESTPLAQTAES